MNDASNECGVSSTRRAGQGVCGCSQGRRFMPQATTFGCYLVTLLLFVVSIVPRSVVAQEGDPFVPNNWGNAIARFVPWLPQTWVPTTIDVEAEECWVATVATRIRAGLERQRTPVSSSVSSMTSAATTRALSNRIVERNPDFDDYTRASGAGAAQSAYNDLRLASGFSPDPRYVEFAAGGYNRAPSGCSGYISSRPDVRLRYSAGSLPLHIWVESSIDTTLVIEGPAGRRCDDDSGDGTDGYVRFGRPRSGTYNIWVGVYSEDDAFEDVSLAVSELDPWFR